MIQDFWRETTRIEVSLLAAERTMGERYQIKHYHQGLEVTPTMWRDAEKHDFNV
jgi:hypothetical protein